MTATACARAVAAALVELGVRHVVLSPGSRSAPLAFAWEALARQSKVELHVRIDERGAAYLALGLAKATRTVVPVVTTSGTAVGNLLPAVMEASHAGVPIMILSCDRPVSALHTGANQVTDQGGLFDRFVRASAQLSGAEGSVATWVHQVGRLVAGAVGVRSADPGPVHLNLAFAEPLTPDDEHWPEVRPTVVEPHRAPPSADDPAPVLEWGVPAAPWSNLPEGYAADAAPEPRTVVLVGDCPPETGRLAWQTAVDAGLPLLSEPSGNARRTPAIRGYRLLLGTELGERIERVLLFGHPTLSRPVSRLLARDDVEIIAVTDGARWIDPGCRVTRVVDRIDPPPGDPAWLRAWRDADDRLLPALDAESGRAAPSEPTPLNGLAVAGAVWHAATRTRQSQESGRGHNLVIGSSHPVRDLDLAPVLGTAPPAYANRGLAGIDGTIATAAGIALATGPTTLLLGDLTFLHDAGSLLIGPLERRPDLRVVVVNDDGGSIFHILEQGAADHAAAFERIFGTPTGARLGPLAAGYGWAHRELTTLTDLRAALAEPIRGTELVEMRITREDRRGQAARLARAGEAAVRA
ncbi:2-succinyl-5-enolpyruvyl-6-hydroxy-3-cyclohexene-1-carboxylic-acid synthase [Granulicoccus sp. GXG6511]|uniref:2-succinyl-5-enolpyruvyl-6-hydroxy-3- cyclohexene-1-carboxylic-acid synthase n=1 Tax=Granulicoccus sp. GXG6511 TaxID=3381351 RepID=UPI003D7D6D76